MTRWKSERKSHLSVIIFCVCTLVLLYEFSSPPWSSVVSLFMNLYDLRHCNTGFMVLEDWQPQRTDNLAQGQHKSKAVQLYSLFTAQSLPHCSWVSAVWCFWVVFPLSGSHNLSPYSYFTLMDYLSEQCKGEEGWNQPVFHGMAFLGISQSVKDLTACQELGRYWNELIQLQARFNYTVTNYVQN